MGTEKSQDEMDAVMKAAWKKKNIDKFVSIKTAKAKIAEEVKAVAGEVLYYPVGFDGKLRQYMAGYPINPQGAKTTRQLFQFAKTEKPVNVDAAIAGVEAEGLDVFGETWLEVSEAAEELVADYMNPKTIAACSTKGKPDIDKFAILNELVKLKAMKA